MQVIQENEVIVILLGIGVLFFVILNWRQLEPLGTRRTLIFPFLTLVTGWILTNIEAFFFAELINFLEHCCYAISAVAFAIWVWQEFRTRG